MNVKSCVSSVTSHFTERKSAHSSVVLSGLIQSAPCYPSALIFCPLPSHRFCCSGFPGVSETHTGLTPASLLCLLPEIHFPHIFSRLTFSSPTCLHFSEAIPEHTISIENSFCFIHSHSFHFQSVCPLTCYIPSCLSLLECKLSKLCLFCSGLYTNYLEEAWHTVGIS